MLLYFHPRKHDARKCAHVNAPTYAHANTRKHMRGHTYAHANTRKHMRGHTYTHIRTYLQQLLLNSIVGNH
jgi:hypothetical protein